MNDNGVITIVETNFSEGNEHYDIKKEDFYEHFKESDRINLYFYEFFDKNIRVKPFLIFTIPKEKGYIRRQIEKCLELFKQHLVDCGLIEDLTKIVSICGMENSNKKEYVFKYILNCGDNCFDCISTYSSCLEEFKNRIFLDENCKEFKESFCFENQKKEIQFIVDCDSIISKIKEGIMIMEIFGNDIEKEKNLPYKPKLGFLSPTKTKWMYFDAKELNLDEEKKDESYLFPFIKEEFLETLITHSMTSDTFILSKLNSKENWMKLDYYDYKNPMYLHWMKIYPFEEIWKKWGHLNREWAIRVFNPKEYLKRYIFFDNHLEMKYFILKKMPDVIDIGPIYKKRPENHSNEKFEIEKEKLEPIQRELIFDIDLPEYWIDPKQPMSFNKQIPIRFCCKEEPQLCSKCWKLAKFAIQFLNSIMTNIFGFKDLQIIFSGGKGVHLIIFDEKAKNLSEFDRINILKFLDIQNCIFLDYPIFKKIFNEFALPISQELLKDQGPQLQSILNQIQKWPQFQGNQEASIFYLLWPRIDQAVSKGMNHLIKSPFVIHPKTKRIASPIPFSNLNTFDPIFKSPILTRKKNSNDIKEEK